MLQSGLTLVERILEPQQDVVMICIWEITEGALCSKAGLGKVMWGGPMKKLPVESSTTRSIALSITPLQAVVIVGSA